MPYVPVPAVHLYISTYVDAFTYTRLYSARKWRAYVYNVDTDSRAAHGRTERQTDGQQICNALTPVLNEMRYGGRETVSGWSAGWRLQWWGFGGWPAVGANSHLTNPIINN